MAERSRSRGFNSARCVRRAAATWSEEEEEAEGEDDRRRKSSRELQHRGQLLASAVGTALLTVPRWEVRSEGRLLPPLCSSSAAADRLPRPERTRRTNRELVVKTKTRKKQKGKPIH